MPDGLISCTWMFGCSLFHCATTAGMPLSQSVIVRCTTPPALDEEADEDDVEDAVVGDELELQAAKARAEAASTPAAARPGLEKPLNLCSPFDCSVIR